MLNHQQGVRCFQELLSEVCFPCQSADKTNHWASGLEADGECLSAEHFHGDLNSWLVHVVGKPENNGKTVGFKALGRAFHDHPDFMTMIRNELDVIHLTRDPGASAISAHYALKIGYHNVPSTDIASLEELTSVKQQPVRLDPSVVVAEAQYAKSWQDSLKSMVGDIRGTWIDVRYEEIFSTQFHKTLSHSAICSLLEIPEVHISEQRFARNIESHSSQIENFDDVATALESEGLPIQILHA